MGANQRFIDRGEGDLCTSSPAGPSLSGQRPRVDIQEAGGRGPLGGWAEEANRSCLDDAANRNVKGEAVRGLCRGKKIVLAKLYREADTGKRLLHDDPKGQATFPVHIMGEYEQPPRQGRDPTTRRVDTGGSNA